MPPRESLVRVMGTFALAAAIVNITIGGGIFRLPANVASTLGTAAPLAYLVCAVAMALIVLCIADAGSRVSLTGGPYAYVGVAFGAYAGFVSGVLLWMLGTFATAAVATVFASSVGLIAPALAGRGAEVLLLMAAFAFWSMINVRGVALGSRLNSIATIAKLVPLLLIGIGGLFFMTPQNLAWTTTPAPSEVARASLLLIFAFAGLEVALVPSGEVRDTARTVPRAIALAMVGITVLYLALQFSSQGILGDQLEQSTVSPLADAAAVAFGGWGRTLLLAGASISMFGYLGGVTLSVPRMLYAFARDGFLPSALGRVHSRFHSPDVAIVIQSVLVVLLAVTGTFERLAILANVSALALYLGCALAAWELRRRGVRAEGAVPFRVPAARVVPWLAIAVIAWLLTGLTRNEWLGFAACIALASVVYAATSSRRKVA